MDSSSSKRFNSIASGYASSELHASNPTLDRLHTLLPQVNSVCDIACGAGRILARLASTPADELAALEITQDADGDFRLPIRTQLIVGRKSYKPQA